MVPSDVEPEKSSTVLLTSADPVNVGVVSDVMLSVDELPVSVPALKFGVAGAEGAALSILTDSAEDADAILPAVSVAFAVML